MDTDIEPYQSRLQSQNLDFQSDLSQFHNRPLVCFVAPLLRSISRLKHFIAWRHAECPVTCFKVSEVRTKVTWWVSLSDSSIGKLCYTMDCEFQIDELMRSQAFYKASKVRFDDDPEFKLRAQQAVVLLQWGHQVSQGMEANM